MLNFYMHYYNHLTILVNNLLLNSMVLFFILLHLLYLKYMHKLYKIDSQNMYYRLMLYLMFGHIKNQMLFMELYINNFKEC